MSASIEGKQECKRKKEPEKEDFANDLIGKTLQGILATEGRVKKRVFAWTARLSENLPRIALIYPRIFTRLHKRASGLLVFHSC